MTIISVLPLTEVTSTSNLLIVTISLAGIVFTLVVLINIIFQNLTKKNSLESINTNSDKKIVAK